MTLIKKRGVWYLTTLTYRGASRDLNILLADARIESTFINIKGIPVKKEIIEEPEDFATEGELIARAIIVVALVFWSIIATIVYYS